MRRLLLAFTTAVAVAVVAGPAAAHAASPGLLNAGDSGRGVHAVRVQLARLGYLPSAGGSTYDAATVHGVIAFQKVRGLDRDGVAGPQTHRALTRAARAGDRPRPALRVEGRRVEVDLSQQVAKLIVDGRVRRTIAVSSGMPGHDTPTGSFHVFRKELRSWSVPYGVWLPYASYFVGGVAFHAYPSVPTSPASHGCVRVPEPFAAELYRFARAGTRVDVLP